MLCLLASLRVLVLYAFLYCTRSWCTRSSRTRRPSVFPQNSEQHFLKNHQLQNPTHVLIVPIATRPLSCVAKGDEHKVLSEHCGDLGSFIKLLSREFMQRTVGSVTEWRLHTQVDRARTSGPVVLAPDHLEEEAAAKRVHLTRSLEILAKCLP